METSGFMGINFIWITAASELILLLCWPSGTIFWVVNASERCGMYLDLIKAVSKWDSPIIHFKCISRLSWLHSSLMSSWFSLFSDDLHNSDSTYTAKVTLKQRRLSWRNVFEQRSLRDLQGVIRKIPPKQTRTRWFCCVNNFWFFLADASTADSAVVEEKPYWSQWRKRRQR